MSADPPRRGSSRQRSPSTFDFMSYLFGPPDRRQPSTSATASPAAGTSSRPPGMPSESSRLPSQNRHDHRPQEAPPFSPFGQEHPPQSSSLDGPALAPLSALHSSTSLQQPLPPLRSLNRGILPSIGSLPHLLPQSHLPQPPPPPLSVFPRPAPSRTPASDLPFGYRVSRRRPSNLNSAISTLNEISHNLDDANSHLRALLDMPSPNDLLNYPPPSLPSSFPHMMSSRPGGGVGSRRESSRSDESGRMSKRRKLDADKAGPPPYKGFRYGRYGQVEPGPLTMEIVSCDGGLYSDGTSYAAENILKTDNSVYCTKGNRCNIVLQHQGCTTFSLKELIIKAPGRNYSSPVREGMVFLSMSKNELLRTEQYQSNVTPSATSLFQHIDALRQRAGQRVRQGNPPLGLQGRNENDEDDIGDPDDAAPYGEIHNLALNGSDHTPSAAPADLDLMTNPPTFYVMTECSDDEDEEATGRGGRERDARGVGWRSTAGWSPTPLRNRPRRRMPLYDESSPFGAHLITWDVDHNYEDDDDDDYTELYDLGDVTISSPESPPDDGEAHGAPRARADNRDRGHDRARDRAGQNREHGEASSSSLPNGPSFFEGRNIGQIGHEVQAAPPHAEFHIEKNKNKCTIRFDPPVTARYILLKMWNPRQDMAGNIDIQGVVAKGFAGPRYFPALELR